MLFTQSMTMYTLCWLTLHDKPHSRSLTLNGIWRRLSVIAETIILVFSHTQFIAAHLKIDGFYDPQIFKLVEVTCLNNRVIALYPK